MGIMRKTLLATTALACAGALAAAPASAADQLSVGVGGYMQQWFGVSDVDNSTDKEIKGGVSQYSDSEIFIRGNLEADNGLTFSVKVEFEGNTQEDVVDESQVTVSGEFGQITLGSEDHVAALMHYGTTDVGVGLNCGDAGFINGVTGCAKEDEKGLGTSGWLIGGDDQKVSYVTPRMSGVQFGASYIPDTTSEDEGVAPVDNDRDAWAVGLNVQQELGEASVAISAGHYQASQVAAGEGITKIDDRTFSNFGLQVGFGAVGFDVAYAAHDGGKYDAGGKKNKVEDYEVVSAGVNYTDGPLAVSLSHMMADADDGSDAGATMFSVSYSLAPGIASRTTLLSAEQEDKGEEGYKVEGNAFITGITLNF